MKKLLLTLIVLLMPTMCWADKCYVFINKIEVNTDNPKQSVLGEVIRIVPVAESVPPNANELRNHKVVIMDLTDEQKVLLMSRDDNGYKIKKFDYSKVEALKDNVELKPNEKTTVINSIADRTVSVTP